MKTTRLIIVVLFVLMTTQIASAYYCPSTGRWLSRDPHEEQSFALLRNTQNDHEKTQREEIQRLILRTKFSWLTKLRLAEIWQVNLNIPIEVDQNGKNLYLFNFNAPVQSFDALGLSGCDYGCFRLTGGPMFNCSLYNDDCDGNCPGALVMLFPNIDGNGVVWFFHYKTSCPGCIHRWIPRGPDA
jgi:hypothetical protein